MFEKAARLFRLRSKENKPKNSQIDQDIEIDLGELLDQNKPNTSDLEKMSEQTVVERMEKKFDLDAGMAIRDKAPGKGEDRTIMKSDNDQSLFAVLDGMGGQEGGGGDVAAQIVSESFQKSILKETHIPKDQKQVEQLLKDAVLTAHHELNNSHLSAVYEKMGTTISAMLCYDNKASVVSVGDSRVYRIRKGKLEQLSYEDSIIHILKSNGIEMDSDKLSEKMPDGTTHDITLNEALKTAKIKPVLGEQSTNIIKMLVEKFGNTTLKKMRNINTQGLASNEDAPFPHVITVDVEPGDEFMITSDGLTDNCSDLNIENKLKQIADKPADAKAAALRDYAYQMQNKNINPDANKPDDISIIYIKTKEKQPAQSDNGIMELTDNDYELAEDSVEDSGEVLAVDSEGVQELSREEMEEFFKQAEEIVDEDNEEMELTDEDLAEVANK